MRCYMGKHFFGFEDGDFAYSITDNMAIVIIPHDSFHESQIWIPAIRGNRTTYTHISSTFQVAALFL